MLSPPAFSFPTKVLLLAEMNRKIKSMKEREIVMITIQGLYNTAVCYTPELEEAARKQIQTVCDQAEFAGCKIRIMPDVHAGKGCTIGTTMTIQDKIVPGMVGVDIGCGMETVELREREVDFEKLDALIRREIPYGRDVWMRALSQFGWRGLLPLNERVEFADDSGQDEENKVNPGR